jgi:hypothetical protein
MRYLWNSVCLHASLYSHSFLMSFTTESFRFLHCGVLMLLSKLEDFFMATTVVVKEWRNMFGININQVSWRVA